MSSKNELGTKIGLIAATVGSAVGLGNVWRFPAETQTNGGAAFLLLYIVCVLLLGIPVMLAEFSLGRGGRSDAIGVFKKLSTLSKWWITGLLAVIASYIIICYYMVVAGWTLEYFIESVGGGLYDTLNAAASQQSLRGTFSAKMDEYVSSDLRPLLYTYAMIAINIAVLLGGVRKGIENLSNVLMPLLFVILLVLCFITLSLPDSGEGVKFFLTPDFSRITPGVVVSALGQAFFSLSLGMGILITYSSYYPADTKLVRTSVIVSLLSLLVAVLMGLIIFPAVKSFGLDSEPLRGACADCDNSDFKLLMKNAGKYAKIAIVIAATAVAAGIKMCSVYGDRYISKYAEAHEADTVAANRYLDSLDRAAAEKDSLKAARRKAKEAKKNRGPKIRSLLDEPVPYALPDDAEKN